MNDIIENAPKFWLETLPKKQPNQHKYDHGHALIYAAPELMGATTLAAQTCARIGTGLVTVLAPQDKADTYRCILPPHILVRTDPTFDDKRVTAKLYGSGGLSVEPDFNTSLPVVLDADALSVLPKRLAPNYILTPHQGEFDRAFPDIEGDRMQRVQIASKRLNCVIVLKGFETLIVSPDGRTVKNTHASPWLATAGSGDVLAGMITGLAAQKINLFDACCAAVWIHGECALQFGYYLVASDLPDLVPVVIKRILAQYQKIPN
jgi:NAD(P)H-hydrate repair Nnr-like enzyme with NAD(P)H-hydrate dehydratase domain